ncbi:hypothetical protein COCMIDRAFT_37658 [Bipolaris oryzae ATCC 44560]|uniref:Uncharacterized protein n=1 Tax=Bipolaris oryzae ATCC 44560 TaxID=930090 RepID=W6ZLW6_COCMI|nr:uncharacterized protein COCMIDRAFT_37658 [Bipolaris oryzae ATCC 44560]EUC44571.1 hypothetical protein COCMIDRAFT_37658 [Bipolaris oryzae ATCC 44560]
MEAFQLEMIRRLIGMLAGYFDTPDQVVSAVQAALGEQAETRDDEETTDSSNTIVEQSRSPKKKTRSHSSELQEATLSRGYDNNLDGVLVDVERPTIRTENTVSNSNTISQRKKDRKISSTWDWNIKPDQVTDEASIRHAFPRTADLFAYHVLPATQHRLGLRASRKEIRLNMQSLLGSIAQEEFNGWVESLDKLLKGDRGMLARPNISLVNDSQLSPMTPAPSRSKLGIRNNDMPLRKNTIIKFEDAEGSGGILPDTQETLATVVRRNFSTEDRDLGSAVLGIEADSEIHTSRSQGNDSIDSSFGMPVLQLLWGTYSLTPNMCVNDHLEITETIMNNLQRRVPAEAIASGLGGQSKTRTKDELRSSIVLAFPKPGQFINFMRIKKDIEGSLVEQVIAEPQAFPELKSMPFVFAHILPHIRVAIESLFGSWSAVSALSGVQLWGSILEALKQRGLSEASVGAANIDCLQIDSLCNNCKFPEVTRRALLERIFRRLVFLHKDKFSELKATPVVKVWERKTGLVW